jgi:hypothetical protein
MELEARACKEQGAMVWEGCVNERPFPHERFTRACTQSQLHFPDPDLDSPHSLTHSHTPIATRTSPFSLDQPTSLPVCPFASAHDWTPRTRRAGPCICHPRHLHITGTFPPWIRAPAAIISIRAGTYLDVSTRTMPR